MNILDAVYALNDDYKVHNHRWNSNTFLLVLKSEELSDFLESYHQKIYKESIELIFNSQIYIIKDQEIDRWSANYEDLTCDSYYVITEE